MANQFYAHIRMDEDVPVYQSLQAHCENTGKYAEEALKSVGLGTMGMLGGKNHDSGKARLRFQQYLFDATVLKKPVKRGSVNHTSAGCRFFLEEYHGEEDVSVTAELLAYACGAHHGLFDCLDTKKGFECRCTDDSTEFLDIKKDFLEEQKESNDGLFMEAEAEIVTIIEKIQQMCRGRQEEEIDFYVGMLARLILSAIMEGDRRDTAEFISGRKYPEPLSGDEMKEKWRRSIDFMESKLDGLDSERPINKARRCISDQCVAFAKRKGGIIRLNVPTGGGKTIASLRYALHHSERYGKTRIIFTNSLLSVLDQNVQVIRSYLPDPEMVLEHHSNVVQPMQDDEREEWEIMTEAWRSPVVVTTLVQLLNTMFLGKTSNIRRFHALCNAVLVIDEVQTVPNNLLTLFNLAVNFLSEVCGTTVVLCSATQPCLIKADHPILLNTKDMVPHDDKLWQVFQRTKIQRIKERKLEDIPALAAEVLQEKDSLLIVCNMKKEAKTLFELCENLDAWVFHLSAGMCMQHRRDTLQQMQEAMHRKEKVLCISTQVIEAGVDISFCCVVRFLAGMDSVVQSAGRCNRNGESTGLADVYVVECIGEKLGRLKTIRAGQVATGTLLEAYSRKPDIFDNQLTSDKAIDFYFGKLYAQMDRFYQDGPIRNTRKTMFDLLSGNWTGNVLEGKYVMHQAFQTAGECFSVFDTDTIEAVVGYGKGRSICQALIEQSESYTPDYQKIAALTQKAKPYTVSLYRYQRELLEKKGALISLFEGRIMVLSDGFYNERTGFTTDEQFWEV